MELRMITHEAVRYNAAPVHPLLLGRGLFLLVWVMVVLGAAGCSRDDGQGAKAPEKIETGAADCAVVTDTSAWTEFKDVADRIAAGAALTKDDLDAFGDHPAVAKWRHSLQPDVPPAQRVGNWLEATFWQELGRQGEQKFNKNRTTFMRSYRYSVDHRDRIDERLAELTGPRKCDIDEMARFWVKPDSLPETLTIHFLPTKAEFRVFEGSLLVDTGVVGAGSVQQVVRQMASLLYRKYQFVPGGIPTELNGAEAIAHSLRVIMNEGLAGWIEQTANLFFDREHPSLRKVKFVPENSFLMTQRTIDLFNSQLGAMLADEDVMNEKGQALAVQLAAMNAHRPAGFGMSAVIAAHLGEDRLRDAGRSVPAFLAAFQEAASRNQLPVPVPGDPGTELFQTVPPLDPAVFNALHAMLTGIYPE